MRPGVETVDAVDLALHPNEASDLAVVAGGLAASPRRSSVGIRALHRTADGHIHAIVGSLDALGKDSALVCDHTAAGHLRFLMAD